MSAVVSTHTQAVGQDWLGYVVSVGAIASVTDTEVVCLYAAARLLLVLGRDRLLPAALVGLPS